MSTYDMTREEVVQELDTLRREYQAFFSDDMPDLHRAWFNGAIETIDDAIKMLEAEK